MSLEQLRVLVAASIASRGVRETSRRIGLATETTLRLATPGAKVHPGSVAMAEKNAASLQQDGART